MMYKSLGTYRPDMFVEETEIYKQVHILILAQQQGRCITLLSKKYQRQDV